ncbi:hypothetical protein DEU56DRAFT_821789 [Suillus clintonianus]|uniref:uncharacterized protein n=1 Tax=Suillus clintonianus TaxID=1904413 RepID=UPI001B8789E5|nr:uncharacterized protein DEU56DRAFT_821789 [Suillus clintonianus]KAG2126816.1 hypothetical protein DEU56DRAFT_821789 [Suillus clintonianus]
MCYWRRVRNVYLRCGHAINLPDQLITCENTRCKFSPNHPTTCGPPTCKQTCCQYRQYPQQYSPNINSFCPTCEAAGYR